MTTRETNGDRHCLVTGHSGSSDSEEPGIWAVPRPGSVALDSTRVGGCFSCQPWLYVALKRLEEKEWIRAEWARVTTTARQLFYSLTVKGREQLAEKIGEWRRLTRAMSLALDADHGPQNVEARACSGANSR